MPNKKGFTLIEVLIASVILVIVMGSMTMVFIEANRAWTQTEAKLQVYQNAREALSRMTRELTCAYKSSSAASTLQKFKWNGGLEQLSFTAAFNINYSTNEYDLTKLGYWLD
ncbi:MAG: prepilin-type N-terminal cleavage/methylation domain-containing protein, partial [Candidatus Omnitrophica bacterium]|nr:prepilin-type N-terminal cleavage/methylation domain-containing protein [Candidatus Omnitrophota bacterium]